MKLSTPLSLSLSLLATTALAKGPSWTLSFVDLRNISDPVEVQHCNFYRYTNPYCDAQWEGYTPGSCKKTASMQSQHMLHKITQNYGQHPWGVDVDAIRLTELCERKRPLEDFYDGDCPERHFFVAFRDEDCRTPVYKGKAGTHKFRDTVHVEGFRVFHHVKDFEKYDVPVRDRLPDWGHAPGRVMPMEEMGGSGEDLPGFRQQDG